MVLLSGVGATQPPPAALQEPAPGGAADTAVWFAKPQYDGQDIIIVLAAGVIFGAALTAKRER